MSHPEEIRESHDLLYAGTGTSLPSMTTQSSDTLLVESQFRLLAENREFFLLGRMGENRFLIPVAHDDSSDVDVASHGEVAFGWDEIAFFCNNFIAGQIEYLLRSKHLSMSTQSSSTLSAARYLLKQRVSSLLKKADKEGWDGEDAARLNEKTVKVAQELVDRFPIQVVHDGAPDVDVTPHGEVDFDWVVDKNTMLTVSILPSKEIAFSGLFHDARVNGREPWKGVLPQFVNCCFERLEKSGNL